MIVITVASILIAVGTVIYARRRQARVMEGLGEMLEQAMNGTFIESAFDETRRSALENRLAQYLAASELSVRNIAGEKNKIKTLIADISHQTKTPIANILLYTEMLQEKNLEQEEAEYVDSLHQQAEKLQFLIASLVKLSRLETGIISLKPEIGDISEAVEQAVDQYREKVTEKGLKLVENYVKADAVFDCKWSVETLCNLLDNAVKYTDSGEITVGVKPYELFVCVKIADTGIGIPEEEQAKVFSRFYRSVKTASQEGVGIGLYLSREILAEEGGYLKLMSKPGTGSVFSAYFPRSISASGDSMSKNSDGKYTGIGDLE